MQEPSRWSCAVSRNVSLVNISARHVAFKGTREKRASRRKHQLPCPFSIPLPCLKGLTAFQTAVKAEAKPKLGYQSLGSHSRRFVNFAETDAESDCGGDAESDEIDSQAGVNPCILPCLQHNTEAASQLLLLSLTETLPKRVQQARNPQSVLKPNGNLVAAVALHWHLTWQGNQAHLGTKGGRIRAEGWRQARGCCAHNCYAPPQRLCFKVSDGKRGPKSPL